MSVGNDTTWKAKKYGQVLKPFSIHNLENEVDDDDDDDEVRAEAYVVDSADESYESEESLYF